MADREGPWGRLLRHAERVARERDGLAAKSVGAVAATARRDALLASGTASIALRAAGNASRRLSEAGAAAAALALGLRRPGAQAPGLARPGSGAEALGRRGQADEGHPSAPTGRVQLRRARRRGGRRALSARQARALFAHLASAGISPEALGAAPDETLALALREASVRGMLAHVSVYSLSNAEGYELTLGGVGEGGSAAGSLVPLFLRRADAEALAADVRGMPGETPGAGDVEVTSRSLEALFTRVFGEGPETRRARERVRLLASTTDYYQPSAASDKLLSDGERLERRKGRLSAEGEAESRGRGGGRAPTGPPDSSDDEALVGFDDEPRCVLVPAAEDVAAASRIVYVASLGGGDAEAAAPSPRAALEALDLQLPPYVPEGIEGPALSTSRLISSGEEARAAAFRRFLGREGGRANGGGAGPSAEAPAVSAAGRGGADPFAALPLLPFRGVPVFQATGLLATGDRRDMTPIFLSFGDLQAALAASARKRAKLVAEGKLAAAVGGTPGDAPAPPPLPSSAATPAGPPEVRVDVSVGVEALESLVARWRDAPEDGRWVDVVVVEPGAVVDAPTEDEDAEGRGPGRLGAGLRGALAKVLGRGRR